MRESLSLQGLTKHKCPKVYLTTTTSPVEFFILFFGGEFWQFGNKRN
jgi:hypothetical protein